MTDPVAQLYPSAAPASAPAGTAIVPAASAAAATEVAAAESVAVGKPNAAVNAMFSDSAAFPAARFGEPAAQPRDLAFTAPPGWGDSAADQAERASLGAAMASMGAPASIARELWGDVVAAATRPVATTEAECMTALRAAWGSRTDANIELARRTITELAAKFPQAREYLISSGLGNDPAFIMKVVAATHRKR